MKPEEKAAMMNLLKMLTESIGKAKEDLKQIIAQHLAATSGGRTRRFSDVQKDLLDAELELFNAQQDNSENLAEIQKKVNNLRVMAAQKGMLPTSRTPRGRGGRGGYFRGGFRGSAMRGYRGSPRGRGRGAFVIGGATKVDRRPTKILVSGYEIDEKEELYAHLGKFGEILDKLEDEATPSVIVHYKTRREAENAMKSAKSYGDRLLQLSWYTSPTGGDGSEHDQGESEHSALDDQSEILDDYTPLDPAYLPPGLEEDKKENVDTNTEEDEAVLEEGDEEVEDVVNVS